MIMSIVDTSHQHYSSIEISTAKMLRLFLVLAVLGLTRIGRVSSHEESGEWNCESDSEKIRVEGNYKPGIITLDGHIDDWKDIEGSEFSLLPALDPDDDKEYNAGKMSVKVLHDGKDVFFSLQVDGKYAYSKGENKKCPSVALMFQIGENATYHGMGGCKESTDTCTSKTCQGHEVDIMHFSIGNAIPGRLYGRNPVDNKQGYGGDRYGHLVDVYSWNPHCRYLNGMGPTGNDSSATNNWNGAWWHTGLTSHSGYIEEDSPYSSDGQSGTYYFEFSRPLRTMDHLQQDVQFSIGKSSKMSVAFWYPEDGKPWHGSGHYSIGCDWVSLDIVSGDHSAIMTVNQKSPWDVATAFSLLLSVAAFCTAVFVGHKVSRNKGVPFTPINDL